MPWYTYVCEKCGETVQRKASIAHRQIMPVHRDGAGCGDGRLRRLAPALGPADPARGPARRASETARSAGGGDPDAGARAPGEGGAEHGAGPAAPPAELGPSREAWALETLSTILTDALAAPRRAELIRRLLATVPSLSLKLRMIETVARSGEGLGAAALLDGLAAEIADAPLDLLARERRLLDLLMLARRHGTLGAAEIGRRLMDDRVMVRLLRSAIRWTPEAGEEGAEPPFLAWSDLLRLAGAQLLHARILQLVALPDAGDASDRLVIAAAAERDGGRAAATARAAS